ncbi:MAG: hypothetical protein JSW54_08255 [Fidelibacterota bacterium]|nr:MAG: hypothetical protein JSW54_08255 [Candidatus Neomarinimicrobiota bacterium]
MKLCRTLIRSIFLLSICVGIEISAPGCTNDNNTGPDTSTIGTIHTPSNDYQVVGIITGLGFFGCAQVTVEDGNGNVIANATVEVNNKSLAYNTGSEAYTDDDEQPVLEYGAGKVYQLTVTVANNIIAEGITQMPTIPMIISPPDSSHHTLLQSLAVGLNNIRYATSVHVLVATPSVDADGNWLNDTTYGFTVPSGQQEITIPGTAFEYSGEYLLSVEAVSGIASSLTLFENEVEAVDVGYNIKGPRGIFVAQSMGGGISLFIP